MCLLYSQYFHFWDFWLPNMCGFSPLPKSMPLQTLAWCHTCVLSCFSCDQLFCDTMDCSLPGLSVHWILQASMLKCVAIPSSRGSSWPRNQTCISCGSCIEGGFFYLWATGETLSPYNTIYLYLIAQLVKNPPAMQETPVQFLGWEDSLEKGKATHFSILAWRMPWTIVHGVAKSRTGLNNFHFFTSPV